MEEITLTGQSISAFREFLVENEKARATVEKYVQEAEQLRLALCGAPVTKAGVLAYRERLQQQYRALTVNNKLSAVNAYLRFCGAEHCEVKLLKVQRRAFREEQRDLTESEYRRLLSIAKGRKNQRLYHVMLTICATGIRVSELRFITTYALRAGRTEIRLKGKCRTVLLPQELAERLRRYQEDHVSRLLSSNGIALLQHTLQHVAVAHGGALQVHPVLFGEQMQPQIGHDGGHHRVSWQLPLPLHVQTACRHDLVAVDQLPPLIHCQTAVCHSLCWVV